jgi:integrase
MKKPIPIRYYSEDTDRHGNRRGYTRIDGVGKIRVKALPPSAEFYAEHERNLKELLGRRDGTAPSPKPKRGAPANPNSLGWLIGRYYEGAKFRQLDPKTQKVRRGILDKVRERPAGRLPYRQMQPRHVATLRDEKLATPAAANSLVKALRQVFTWAMKPETDLADDNPAAKVDYLDGSPDGFHTWTLEEVEAFEEHHAIGTKARLALALLLYTGVRRSDLVRLGPQHIREIPDDNGALRPHLRFEVFKGRNSNPKTLTIPILPTLQAILDATPSGHLTFLATEFGKPYSGDGFGNWFRRQCRAVGLKECSSHGLRKAGATLAAEGGATAHELMAMYGWDSLKQPELYTRKASQARLARPGAAALEAGRIRNKNVPPLTVVRAGGTKKGKKS